MNDIEKAIEIYKDNIWHMEQNPDAFESDLPRFKLVLQALEKQIPKRPRANGNGSVEYPEDWLECPLCGEMIPEYTSENETECYCVGCGQALKGGAE